MGLLDFFSKGNSKATGTNQNPPVQTPSVPQFTTTQNNPPQNAGFGNFSNISYPLPSTDIPSNLAANNVQAQNLDLPPVAQPPEMTAAPLDTTGTMQTDTAKTNEPPDILNYEYTDPSKHPKVPEPEPEKGYTFVDTKGVKTVSFEPVVNPTVADPVQALPALDSQQPVMPAVEAVQPVVEQATPSVQDIMASNLPNEAVVQSVEQTQVIENKPLDIVPPAIDIPVVAPAASSLVDLVPNTSDSKPEVEQPIIQEQSAPVETPAVPQDLTGVNGMEFGVGGSEVKTNIPFDANAPEVLNQSDSALMQELKSDEPTTDAAIQPVNDSINELQKDLNNVAEAVKVEEAPAVSTGAEAINESEISPMDEVKTETVVPTAAPIAPEIPVAELPKLVTEIKEPEVSPVSNTDIEKEIDVKNISRFRSIKHIGFLCLNTEAANPKVSQKIQELTKALSKEVKTILIDSAKGYGKDIIDSLNSSSVELKGLFLRPYYSTYNDESENSANAYITTVMYSDPAERTKSMLRESDAIVIPELDGINNISQFLTVWSVGYIYIGQNKPVLLLGKGWKTMLQSIKDNFKLSDSELSILTVCENANDVFNNLVELDKKFAAKRGSATKKVIDLREAEDETGYLMN